MRIKRRQNNAQAQSEIDIKNLVVDIEGAKRAMEVIVEFEQATGLHLLDQNGRIEFSKIYKKTERENRVREMVIGTVRDEVKRQLSPIDLKLNQILNIAAERDTQKTEQRRRPTDEDLDSLHENKTY